VTLRDAIQQLVNLGEKDPREILEKLRDRNGDEWLRDEVAELAEEFVLEIARQELGRRRRASEISRVVQGDNTTGEIKIQSKWIPVVGYKAIGDLTVADCRAVADHYRQLEHAAGTRFRAYNALANLMEEQGVSLVREVRGVLPLQALEKAA
jgi:hypothetical protein